MTESRSRGIRTTLVLLAGALAVLAFGVAQAHATPSHAFSTTYGSATSTPPDPYPVSEPSDIAIDQSSHDVYVTDPGNHRVEKFDAAGNLLLMFGKGVDQTSGANVCTIASGHICQAGTSGSSSGALENPAFLAVDNVAGGNGAVYVGDIGDNLVQKFDSEGHVILSWGAAGQKDGADAKDLPIYGPLYGVAVGGPDGDLYVGGTHYSDNVWEYSRSGTYEGPYQNVSGIPWLKADESGNLYFTGNAGFFGPQVVSEAVLQHNAHGLYDYYQMGSETPVSGFAFDPSKHELYQGNGPSIVHYTSDCDPPHNGPCNPVDSFGSGHLSGARGMDVDGASHAVFVANVSSDDVAVFTDIRPIVTTGPPTDVTASTATLTGTIDPAGRGAISECRFEYGFDQTYGKSLPCTPDPTSAPPGSNFTDLTEVTATVTGLSPGTRDHYRLVAGNTALSSSSGADETFITTAPPAIDGLAAENLAGTSADLLAQINPNGLDTTYHFDYGTTIAYGLQTPSVTLKASNSDQFIDSPLSELVFHASYHYRLVAENADGTTTSEDHTFNFYPPNCPNENARQQTQANYLPDCRAYELVSPPDAGGTQLFPNGPNTGLASDPSRFAFTGLFATIPNSGGRPIDGSGDLYVSSRTDTGWTTKYVGLPSNEAAVDGGPPMGPPGSTPGAIRASSNMAANGGSLTGSTDGVLTDSAMKNFLVFNDGNQSVSSIFTLDFQNRTTIASNAPYVYTAGGKLIDRWPTNLNAVPGGSFPPHSNIYPHGGDPYPNEQPAQVSPGGPKALDCPISVSPGVHAVNYCPGDVTASEDLNHFVFATEWNVFAPGGQLSAPGSVYDNETASGQISVASKAPDGENIQPEPSDNAGDPLQIPAVSRSGSHILMAAGGTGPCGFATCPIPPCGEDYSATKRCQMQLSHLYMRVSEAVTYDVSRGHYVDYVGTNGNATKVYFTSEEELTPDDKDTSTDLYMWAESTNDLTLISKGNNAGNPGEPGQTDSCKGGLVTAHAGATTNCGIATYTHWFYCKVVDGGNCQTDSNIASEAGDIYFFSPEQLDGSRGIPGQSNLYDYREGQTEYVTTLTGPSTCFETYSINTCAKVVRMQVTPDGSRMAFVTASQVTQYDNAGRLEMYTFDPATRKLTCVSCIPSGAKPSNDVKASQDGLFMTDDGRTFFSTEDPLVHTDTNRAQDVYEYVDGRPQLITLGTGDTRRPGGNGFTEGFGSAAPGFVGVSADGRDVYFSTFDTLVSQDHNGLFLKFYDARAGGGFPTPAPPPPCAAADECHGPSSEAPSGVRTGTAPVLGAGGNVVGAQTKPPRSKHRKRSGKRKHSGSKKHSRQGAQR